MARNRYRSFTDDLFWNGVQDERFFKSKEYQDLKKHLDAKYKPYEYGHKMAEIYKVRTEWESKHERKRTYY